MFIPDRASSAITRYNRARNKRFASLDEVAIDLGLAVRPRVGALDWVNAVINAVEKSPVLADEAADQLVS